MNLAVRWIHVIVGIAWIGTSFYFNWLNNRVRPPEVAEEGVAGELWSVHGGGFYRVVKYEVAPDRLPKTLHWFKWEAYATWTSGFALLFIVYYLGPLGIAVDPSKWDLPRWGLVVFGVASLVVGWLVYDALCRTPMAHRPALFSLVGFGMGVAAAWGYSQVMTGRAAYIHLGALIGTIMAANVFRLIIPSQRVMVDAMTLGQSPDPRPGREAALRSLHNNYLTLPVVFIMVSNHFPSTFGASLNWLLLAALSIVGGLVRHWFNLRGQGHRNVWILPAAVAAMVALALVTYPADAEEVAVPDEVWTITQRRCAPCHSNSPTQNLFVEPPKGIVFDRRGDVGARKTLIGNVVASMYMPLANFTEMTEAERATVVEWAQG
jgi:uncharacterized membrane protein